MVEEKQIKTLEKFINMSKRILSSEGLEGVEHYLDHGEYEMSFEGLVIELYTNGMYPTNFKFTEWKELGFTFGLDKESVFDEKFWVKFTEWGQAYIPENP
ncbi:MAG: hypothetical protein K0R18_3021 [Bacillales bacterium]|nr:hypothetical protein [Bacillales bacterium]